MPCSLVLVPLLVFLFVLGHRHGINAGQPAMQVNVGAALRAEWLEDFVHRLAADGAEFAVFGLRHEQNMGVGLAQVSGGVSVRQY